MKGQHLISALRLKGRIPRQVGISCEPFHVWGYDEPTQVYWVHIDPTENPHRLDLRFLVELQVAVFSRDEAKRKAICQACVDAGAVVDEFTGEELEAYGSVPA